MEKETKLQCVECGGEMKEENKDMMKCQECGAMINKNNQKETEDTTKT